MAPPEWIWKVTYSTEKDSDRGRIKTYDGQLHLWNRKDWIALMSAKGTPIVGKYLADGEIVDVGISMTLPGHVVEISECLSRLAKEPFELDVDVFVRFVPHNDRPNHRAVQGVRSGWLMVLSVPLDFRNDYDIANAVAAFDEDPMPLDGNPHPLPGNLLPPDNMFVLPQYPELGWNNVHNNVNHQHHNQNDLQEMVQDNDMQEQNPVKEIVDDSIVVNPLGVASPAPDMNGILQKTAAPVAIVDTVFHRSTRSYTKRDGHHPVSMSDTVSRPRKKSKGQKKTVNKSCSDEKGDNSCSHKEGGDCHADAPETPIHVMQNVGIALGIEPELLTEEKLKAPPKGKKSKTLPNDK
ncbi:hypothetical protein ACQ4PT_013079 [Festuca glaucescens]